MPLAISAIRNGILISPSGSPQFEIKCNTAAGQKKKVTTAIRLLLRAIFKTIQITITRIKIHQIAPLARLPMADYSNSVLRI